MQRTTFFPGVFSGLLCTILLALCLLTNVASAQTAQPQDMFKDVATSNWAYQLTAQLCDKSLLIGYPDGYFRGKRTLTRYEFAVAIDRVMKSLPPNADEISRWSLEDVAMLRRLVNEFLNELRSLSNSKEALTLKLDALSKRLGSPASAPHPSSSGHRTLFEGAVPDSPSRSLPGTESYLRHLGITSFDASRENLTGPERFPQPSGSSFLKTYRAPGFADPTVRDLLTSFQGAQFRLHFGHLGIEAFSGEAMSVGGGSGAPVGLNGSEASAHSFPTAQDENPVDAAPDNSGRLQVQQVSGASVGFGFNVLDRPGHLRLSAVNASNVSSYLNPGANHILVLGADGSIQIADRVSIAADWAKSLTNMGRTTPPTLSDNTAFNANVGFGMGGLSVQAGYRYVDPLFTSPGSWGRIGNWINPVNIQGPTFRAAYDFSSSFGIHLGGDFFSGARNRADVGGLGMDDDINRLLVGVRWNVARNFQTTLDYEGVYWSLEGAHAGIPSLIGTVHPTEHYITLGTGYHLTGNTLLRLNYQIGTFDGHGVLNSGGTQRYNVNTVTGSVAVKF